MSPKARTVIEQRAVTEAIKRSGRALFIQRHGPLTRVCQWPNPWAVNFHAVTGWADPKEVAITLSVM